VNPETVIALSRVRKEAAERKAADAELRALIPETPETLALLSKFRSQLKRVDERVTKQEVSLGEATASIEEVSRVGVSERLALAEQITSLSAEVAGVAGNLSSTSARIEEISAVVASDQLALAAFSRDMRTRFDRFDARYNEQVTLFTTADAALATRTTSLEASVDTPTTGLLARVATIESAYVDASGAYAQAISAITAQLTGPSGSIYSSVQTEASARATADGFLSGKYALKVTAGNVVTGMNITSATGSGTDVSEITFQASSFKIYNGTTGVAPFQVVGGVVKITGSLVISPADVTGLGALATASSVDLATQVTNKSLANVDSAANSKLAGIAAGADVTLSAVNGGLNVTGGGITLSSGGAIKGGASSFGAGTGFFLGYEGGQYKFRVGDPSGSRIEWDGSSWNVVSFPGGGAAPTFALSLSDSVGNPLYVCTGGGTYTTGSIVSISAPTIPGYTFTNWAGASYDEAMVDSLTSQSTTVAVTHNTSLIANYV